MKKTNSAGVDVSVFVSNCASGVEMDDLVERINELVEDLGEVDEYTIDIAERQLLEELRAFSDCEFMVSIKPPASRR